MPSIARSTAPTSSRVTRSTSKQTGPTASSFLVATPLVDSDGSDSEDDRDFSFHSQSQTYSDEDEDAELEEGEIPQWLKEKARGILFPAKRPAGPDIRPEEEAYLAMRSQQLDKEYEEALDVARGRASVDESVDGDKEEKVAVSPARAVSRPAKASKTTPASRSKPKAAARSDLRTSAALKASAETNVTPVESPSDAEEEEVFNKIKDMTIGDF